MNSSSTAVPVAPQTTGLVSQINISPTPTHRVYRRQELSQDGVWEEGESNRKKDRKLRSRQQGAACLKDEQQSAEELAQGQSAQADGDEE